MYNVHLWIISAKAISYLLLIPIPYLPPILSNPKATSALSSNQMMALLTQEHLVICRTTACTILNVRRDYLLLPIIHCRCSCWLLQFTIILSWRDYLLIRISAATHNILNKRRDCLVHCCWLLQLCTILINQRPLWGNSRGRRELTSILTPSHQTLRTHTSGSKYKTQKYNPFKHM